MRSAAYAPFFALAIVCYLAAVIIAFPLGALFEVMREQLSLIPLAIGAFAMAIGMLLETRG
jgi:hypothetical protein